MKHRLSAVDAPARPDVTPAATHPSAPPPTPEPSRTSRNRRRALGAIAIVIGFVAVFVLLLGRPVMRSDEAWFLWVLHRITHGDVLYRDTYFVSTPFPAWLGAIAVSIGGSNLLVVRFVSVTIFVASAAVAWVIATRSGLGWIGRIVLLAGLFVYASPVAHFASVYSALAILGALCACWAALVWLDRRAVASAPGAERRLLWLAGIAIGFAVASKPNTGVLASLALAATILVARSSWRAAWRDIGRVALAATAVVVVVLLPVLWTGGLHGFVSDVVLEKGQYLHVMDTAVLPGFDNAFSILPGHVHVTATRVPGVLSAPTTLGTRYFDTFRFVPFFALAVFAWAIWRTRGKPRGHLTLCVSFGIAALLAALPSAGPQHVTEIMPLLLAAVAGAIGLARLRPAPARVGTVVAAAVVVLVIGWLGFGVAAISGRAIGGLTGDGGSTSSLPHLGSSPVLAADARGTARDVAQLRRLTGGRVFILRADAAYYYLAGNLRNPTPYDFPVLSDFGSAGEAGVIRLVEHHRIPYACVRRHDDPPPIDSPDFRPLALNHAVRHDMRFVAHLNICDVYAAR